MTWKTDFDTGANGFITADDSLFAAQSIGATVVFIWAAWVCLKAYQDWANGKTNGTQMMFVWFRAVFSMSVLLFLLVN